jgi:hypothetical protein
LAKFLKGSITIGELENMPNRFIHSLYKLYIETQKDEDKRKAVESEQMMDEMEDMMTQGGGIQWIGFHFLIE